MTSDASKGSTVLRAVVYPESDGEPIGETDIHIRAVLYLLEALRYVFRRAERIYVAANMLFYYEEGEPRAFRVPDVFVVKGIAKQDRRTYKLWEERAAPCMVVEVTSKSTRLEDVGSKRALYEMLGVKEYVLFDPLGEYLDPRFMVLELKRGGYQSRPLPPDGSFRSAELPVVLRPEGTLLRVVDPETGEVVGTMEEQAEKARVEAERARAEAERARTEAERARQERERADRAEAEAARLRAEIDRLRRQTNG